MTTPERVKLLIESVRTLLGLPVLWYSFGHHKAIRQRMKERLKTQQTSNIFPCALLILDDRERSTGNQQRTVDVRIVFGDFTRETLTTQERYDEKLAALQPIAEAALEAFRDNPRFWYTSATTAEIARVPFIGPEELYEGTSANLFSDPLDCIQLSIRGLVVPAGAPCTRTQSFF